MRRGALVKGRIFLVQKLDYFEQKQFHNSSDNKMTTLCLCLSFCRIMLGCGIYCNVQQLRSTKTISVSANLIQNRFLLSLSFSISHLSSSKYSLMLLTSFSSSSESQFCMFVFLIVYFSSNLSIGSNDSCFADFNTVFITRLSLTNIFIHHSHRVISKPLFTRV